MTTYAYRIFKNAPSHPVIGGTIHARDMEDASHKIIKLNGIKVIHITMLFSEFHHFEYKGEKVGILIYINPEDH